MSPKKREPLVMEYVVARIGFRRALQVLTFASLWVMEETLLGEPITVEYLVEKNLYARTTAYRHQAWFREVFEPFGWDSPTDLVAATKKKPRSMSELAAIRLQAAS